MCTLQFLDDRALRLNSRFARSSVFYRLSASEYSFQQIPKERKVTIIILARGDCFFLLQMPVAYSHFQHLQGLGATEPLYTSVLATEENAGKSLTKNRSSRPDPSNRNQLNLLEKLVANLTPQTTKPFCRRL